MTNFDYMDRFQLTEAMIRYGGGFFQKLASAMRSADATNFQRILDAFPEILKQYGPDSRFYKSSKEETIDRWTVANPKAPRRLIQQAVFFMVQATAATVGFIAAIVICIHVSNAIDTFFAPNSHKAQ